MLGHWFQLLFQSQAVEPEPQPEQPTFGGGWTITPMKKTVENDEALLITLLM